MQRYKKIQSMLSQRGDLLIEVTLALAVMSATLLTALNVANKAFGVGNKAKERSIASGLLQEQAERLRNYRDSHVWEGGSGMYALFQPKFNTSHPPTTFINMDATPAMQSNCAPPSGIYTVCVAAFDVSVPPPAKNKILFDIKVTWSGVGGGQNTSTLSTVLADLDGLAPLVPGPGPGPGPTPSVTLAVAPGSSVAVNTAITLTWTPANVTACNATAGPWSGPKNSSGGSEVRPASDTATPGNITYTISCNGATSSLIVTVTSAPPPPGHHLEVETMTPGSNCVTYRVTEPGAGPGLSGNAAHLDCSLDSATIGGFDVGPAWGKINVHARKASACGSGDPILHIVYGSSSGSINAYIDSTTLSDNITPPLPFGLTLAGGVQNIRIQAGTGVPGDTDIFGGPGGCDVFIDYIEFLP